MEPTYRSDNHLAFSTEINLPDPYLIRVSQIAPKNIDLPFLD
jgi:hypothetical protein